MNPLFVILIFIVATIVGYLLIKNVPSLLHTPLMSGMNALSGITILGALTTVSIITSKYNVIVSSIFGGLAVILAMINVVGGFAVTDRMLKMFHKKEKK
ncbi:MAG TPA: NAD(P) transhydrogenase subunit alpha [Haloplasmataceae bacterium]